MAQLLKSASGRMVHAANPLTYLEPKERQKAMDKAKHFGGNLQDRMDVLMSKIRAGETVVIDVAAIKATMQNDKPPKEKHVAVLKMACAGASPRMQVAYTVHQLAARLEDKPGWLVALKTLMVFHRLMREVDPSFQDEVIRYQERTGTHRLLRLDSFADHTTKDTWDLSAWIRVYSVYLDDRLAAFKSIRYDPESRNAANPADFCKLDSCPPNELLEKLPVVQKLLGRLIMCVPEGAAASKEVSIHAAAMVLRELKAVYRDVSEGIINLTDKFFDMERSDAMRGLEVFKENMQLNDRLNTFIMGINGVAALRGAVDFPPLQTLPADFFGTMEEYVRDAPRAPTTAKAGPTGASTLPQVHRSSTLVRQGGATSGAITGTSPAPTANGNTAPPPPAAAAVPPTPPAPEPLKISPPAPAPAPPKPPPNAIDLLGDDFPVPTPALPPAQPPPFAGSGGGSGDFYAPAALPPPSAGPTGGYGAPPPYAGPTVGYGPPPPYAGPKGGYSAPPPYAGPTGAPPPFAGPTGAPPPFAGPTGAPPPFAGPTGASPPYAGPTGASPPFAGPTGGALNSNPWAVAGFSQPPLALPPPAPAAGGFGSSDVSFGAPAPAADNQLMAFNPYGAMSLPPSQPDRSPAFDAGTGQVNPYGGLSMPPARPTPASTQQPYGGGTAVNPFGGVTPAAPSNPPFAGPTGLDTNAAVSNPFDAPSMYTMPPPAAPQPAQQQQHWGAAPPAPSPQAAANLGWHTSNPTLSAQRQAQDPLRDLSYDLFGQPQQTTQPTLKDLRVSGGM